MFVLSFSKSSPMLLPVQPAGFWCALAGTALSAIIQTAASTPSTQRVLVTPPLHIATPSPFKLRSDDLLIHCKGRAAHATRPVGTYFHRTFCKARSTLPS